MTKWGDPNDAMEHTRLILAVWDDDAMRVDLSGKRGGVIMCVGEARTNQAGPAWKWVHRSAGGAQSLHGWRILGWTPAPSPDAAWNRDFANCPDDACALFMPRTVGEAEPVVAAIKMRDGQVCSLNVDREDHLWTVTRWQSPESRFVPSGWLPWPEPMPEWTMVETFPPPQLGLRLPG